jgi:hypothetical protein
MWRSGAAVRSPKTPRLDHWRSNGEATPSLVVRWRTVCGKGARTTMRQRAPADRIARRFVAILMAEAIAVAPPGDRNTRRSSRAPARQQR